MSQLIEVKVPDIGDFKDVPIIELLIKVGDTVKAEDSLMTLKSDKATMDIPSPVGGVISELKVQVGDKVAEGVLLALVSVSGGSQGVGAGTTAAAPAAASTVATPVAPTADPAAAPAPVAAPVATPLDFRPGAAEAIAAPPRVAMPTPADRLSGKAAHASPSVRRFARELGVDVSKVTGTGPKGRILQSDVQAYVKGVLSAPPAAAACTTRSARRSPGWRPRPCASTPRAGASSPRSTGCCSTLHASPTPASAATWPTSTRSGARRTRLRCGSTATTRTGR